MSKCPAYYFTRPGCRWILSLSSVLFALLFCARCEAGIHVLSFSTCVYTIPTSLTGRVISSYTQMLGFRGSHIHNSFITCLCLWPCSSQGVLPSLAGRIPSGKQLSVYSSSANGTSHGKEVWGGCIPALWSCMLYVG